MVSSSQKRHAAQGVVAAGMCSQRQACRYLGLARSSWAYVSRPPKPRTVQIGEAIAALAVRHPRFGYRRVHEMLRRQGLRCNLRTVQRMRRDQGLGIKGPARRPKVPVRPDAKVKATAVNGVWCVDVVFDTTQGGNTVKFLTIIDEFSHYCLAIIASRRMGAREVVAALAKLVEIHGAPRHLRCDNGAEFIARFLQEWLALGPLRHFRGLLHNDIERDHEAENDCKEVDRQPRDIGSRAISGAFQNAAKHRQCHSGAEHNKNCEYSCRRSLADHTAASVRIGDLKRQHRKCEKHSRASPNRLFLNVIQ
jgi:putative transposase